MASNFLYHSSCPLCGGKDCRTSYSTNWVHCRRSDANYPPAGYVYVGDDVHAFRMFARLDGTTPEWLLKRNRVADYLNSPPSNANLNAPPPRPKTDHFSLIASRKRPMTLPEARKLAQLITAPVDLLYASGIEIVDSALGRSEKAFVIPERDARGAVIGFTCRFYDGTKRNVGARGITLLPGWLPDDPDTPIFLVEGASDTIATTAMGLHAIGRPSNTGGIAILIELLTQLLRQRPTQRIVVVGENDQKENVAWPGREGGEKTAREIAAATGHTIELVFPPAGIKDVRDYLSQEIKAAGGKATAAEVAHLGHQLSTQLLSAPEVFTPDTAAAIAAQKAAADRSATNRMVDEFFATWTISPDAIPKPWHDTRVASFDPDFQPAPSTTHTTTNPAICPCRRGLLLDHRHLPISRAMYVDCERLNCPVCAQKKKDQWKTRVRHHLRDDATPDLIYVSSCTSATRWATIRTNLKRHHSNFFRYNTDGNGNLLIVSELHPGRSATDTRRVTKAEAEIILCGRIQSTPTLPRSHLLTSSRGWGDIETHDRSGQWTRRSELSTPIEAVGEILLYRRATHTIKASRPDRRFGWVAWEWLNVGMTAPPEHVNAEIEAGMIMPHTDQEWLDEYGCLPRWRQSGDSQGGDSEDAQPTSAGAGAGEFAIW